MMMMAGVDHGDAENARVENAGVAIKRRQINAQRFNRRLPAISPPAPTATLSTPAFSVVP